MHQRGIYAPMWPMRSYLVVSSVSCGNNRFKIASAQRQWSGHVTQRLRTDGEVVEVDVNHVLDHVQVFDTRDHCSLVGGEL